MVSWLATDMYDQDKLDRLADDGPVDVMGWREHLRANLIDGGCAAVGAVVAFVFASPIVCGFIGVVVDLFTNGVTLPRIIALGVATFLAMVASLGLLHAVIETKRSVEGVSRARKAQRVYNERRQAQGGAISEVASSTTGGELSMVQEVGGLSVTEHEAREEKILFEEGESSRQLGESERGEEVEVAAAAQEPSGSSW